MRCCVNASTRMLCLHPDWGLISRDHRHLRSASQHAFRVYQGCGRRYGGAFCGSVITWGALLPIECIIPLLIGPGGCAPPPCAGEWRARGDGRATLDATGFPMRCERGPSWLDDLLAVTVSMGAGVCGGEEHRCSYTACPGMHRIRFFDIRDMKWE